ncbi:hypothetical protein HU200_004724 [Digitaria exilis]|uniref:laccase n=1 Tax=Digitaria exilis TaxID=1010633 RepID=A0A835FST7_9POAL|nr:hypothetical protein HU200_004724 [Digitaria exilis]
MPDPQLGIMPGSWLILVLAVSSAAALAHAATVERTFNVLSYALSSESPGNISITAVDGVPGPVIEAYEGDNLVVHVINDSPNNVTLTQLFPQFQPKRSRRLRFAVPSCIIHCRHGVFQRRTPWADGPSMVTHRYTYRFNVTGQEGTLWWHAHSSFLRATVYGALVIRPSRVAAAYPFAMPDGEHVVLLGEWWNNATAISSNANADAYTINGKPGDLYAGETTANRSAKFEVTGNSTYLLRIINAALNTAFFFEVAGHNFTVVAADASYTSPYRTDVIVIAPGQTVDALMDADASPGSYYMAISSYQSASPLSPAGFNGNTTTALVEYAGEQHSPAAARPAMPLPTSTRTANRFYTSMKALLRPGRRTVPLAVDTSMFVTVGLGLRYPCDPKLPSCKPIPMATMNNQSFTLPTTMSMLNAMYYYGNNTTRGVYTSDFPDKPPVTFDYTNETRTQVAAALLFPGRTVTKTKVLRYNATVEVVLQNTALVGRESHPMHLHATTFLCWRRDSKRFNLVDPQERNTVAVPTGGWAVIRFVADNPGMWFMHCHIDSHLAIGLAMVFEVADGPTPDTALPPPPPDLPRLVHERSPSYQLSIQGSRAGTLWTLLDAYAREKTVRTKKKLYVAVTEIGDIYDGNPIRHSSRRQLCLCFVFLPSLTLLHSARPSIPPMVRLLLALALLLVGPVADAATAKYTFTLMTPWADGPSMVSQCPIQPSTSYTYRFSVPGQEGTLWWHAHSSFLRATVYGAFIVRPRAGNAYPFPAPDKEVPIVLGNRCCAVLFCISGRRLAMASPVCQPRWWNRNVVDVENDAILSGQLPAQSDAFTINGKTGLLYQCASTYASHETFTAVVDPNTRVLLRVINAGLNSHLFFKLAGHNFTVVAVDAGYTSNLSTDTLVIAPGQTVDALVTTSASPGSYYMAIQAYDTMSPLTFATSDTTTATAIFQYNGTSTNPPAMPTMPSSSDSATANAFYFGLRGLSGLEGTTSVPSPVDVSMTIELGLGQLPCDPSQTRCNGTAAAAAMNGVSFRLPGPEESSLLGAHVNALTGVFTEDFPDGPPPSGTAMSVGTKVKKLAYNSVVEIVLQNPSAVPTENHPIHLHGFNFFVLAQGVGTFTPGSVSYNLVDPVARNTIAVPGGGWAVIRFVANNPGMWFFHCHLDPHVPMGLGMVFQVDSGTTPGSTLPTPPADWSYAAAAAAAAAEDAAPAPAPTLAPASAPAPANSTTRAGQQPPPRAVDHKPAGMAGAPLLLLPVLDRGLMGTFLERFRRRRRRRTKSSSDILPPSLSLPWALICALIGGAQPNMIGGPLDGGHGSTHEVELSTLPTDTQTLDRSRGLALLRREAPPRRPLPSLAKADLLRRATASTSNVAAREQIFPNEPAMASTEPSNTSTLSLLHS